MATEGTPSWFVGSGLETDMEGDTSAGAGAGARFWMPKNTEKVVIFLTEGSKSITIWEHQIYLGGSWRNWASCLQPLGVSCPLCRWSEGHDGKFRRYKAQFFTLIDTSEFTDKSGKKRKNEKRLMCCKKDTTEKLKRKYLARLENDEGMRGAMFKIFRTNSDKSASVGDDFEFVKMIDLSAIPDNSELDYGELLKPNPERVRGIVDRLNTERSGSASEGTDATVDY